MRQDRSSSTRLCSTNGTDHADEEFCRIKLTSDAMIYVLDRFLRTCQMLPVSIFRPFPPLMKKTLATFLVAVGMAGVCSAATLVNYTASGDPNLAGDANGGTLDVWQCAFTGGGGSGSGYYAPSGQTTNMWDIFTYPAGGVTGTATMTYNLQGDGTLDAGQTISLLYAHNTNIATGTSIGIRLLSASGAVQTEFLFTGGGSGFTYDDTGKTQLGNFMATGKNYDPNDPFTVSFTMTSTTNYTATASNGAAGAVNNGAWSGAINSPIAAIQVVNLMAGDASDQYSNNLVISAAAVPEPTSLALLAGGGLLGSLVLRRRKG